MKKKFKNLEKFIDILVEHEKENPFCLFPAPIQTEFMIDCLTEALLGPNYYIELPCSSPQSNTVILDEILRKYSRDYRKLIRKRKKELKGENKSKL